MRHTVIGVFDTYSEALGAERALVDAGFVRTDIDIYTHEISDRGPGDIRDDAIRSEADTVTPGSPGVAYPGAGLDASTSGFPTETLENGAPAAPGDETYPVRARHAASGSGSGRAGESRTAGEPSPAGPHGEGVLGRIEHFFADLFGGGERPPEIAQYAEALRRGAAIVSLGVEYDAQVALAREVMVRKGAIDIDARASQWPRSGQGFERGASAAANGDAVGAAALSGFPPMPGTRSQPVEPVATTDRRHSFTDELGVTDPVSGRSRLDQPIGAPATETHGQAPSSDWLGDVPAAASAPGSDPQGSSQQADGRREPWRGSIGTTPKPLQEPRADTPSVPGPTAYYEANADRAAGTGVRSYRRRELSEPLPRGASDGLPGSAASAASAVAPAASAAPAAPSAAASAPATGNEFATPREAAPQFSEPLTKAPPSDETASYCDDSCADYDRQYADDNLRNDGRVQDQRATGAHDERYRLGDWEDAEEQAPEEWERGFPGNGWERFKAAVRHGWDRVTGHR